MHKIYSKYYLASLNLTLFCVSLPKDDIKKQVDVHYRLKV